MDYSDVENASDGDDILGPEDLFNDEADEENDRDDEDKAKEAKQDAEVKVEKKIKLKRVIRNPRKTLNYDTLRRPLGLMALKKLFNDFKFKGTNHEEEDLTRIMGILKQWMTYQLCPSYGFESCMLQLETLGKKKVVQTYMKKVRMGLDEWGTNKLDVINSSDNNPVVVQNNNFDLLIQEGMAHIDSDDETSQNEIEERISQNEIHLFQNESHITQNKAEITLIPEQLERIAKNRKLAEERRLKRINSQQEQRNVTAEATENNDFQTSEQMNVITEATGDDNSQTAEQMIIEENY